LPKSLMVLLALNSAFTTCGPTAFCTKLIKRNSSLVHFRNHRALCQIIRLQ